MKTLNRRMFNRRGDTTIPELVFAIAVCALLAFALYEFYLHESGVKATLYIPKIIDAVYTEEQELNFILNGVFDKVLSDKVFFRGYSEDSVGLKNAFLQKFKEELVKYKDFNGNYSYSGLLQVENNLTIENVNILDGKLYLTVRASFGKIYSEDDKELMRVDYNYKKVFERDLQKIFE